jgi:peptide/nickel transport system permease protein
MSRTGSIVPTLPVLAPQGLPVRRWPLALLIALVGFAVFAAWIAPDPLAQNLRDRLLPPAWVDEGSLKHLLGTDQLGRDLLARLLYGLRVSLAIGLIAATGGALIGVTLGMLAGYFRGATENVIMRLADIQLAFPLLVLAIAILALVGGSLVPLVLVLSLFGWALYARVVRAAVLVQRQLDYVSAASIAGAGHLRIMLRHLLPNVMAPILVLWTFSVAQMVVLEGALSFLGLGVRPPAPSLGGIMSDGRQVLELAWWLTVLPGAALVALVIAFNALGDDLRDWLDPRMTGLR